MTVCPRCSSDSVAGKFCGSCGAMIATPVVSPESGEKTHSESVAPAPLSRHDLEELEKAVKKQPDNVQAYINLALALCNLGRLEQAYSTFRAVRAIAPDKSEVLKTGARIFDQMNRRDEAVQCLQQSLAMEPDDSRAIFHLSRLLYDSGKKEEALSCLDRLYQKNNRQPDVLIRIAQIHLSLGNASEAQKYLAIYKEIAGATREMYLLLGQTMLTRRFFDGAVKNFREAVRVYPDDPQMRLGLGRGYLGMGEKGQALLEFEQGINKCPDSAEILIELGKLQNSMGMEDQADQTFAAVEKCKDRSGENFLAIALHFLERKNYARALKFLEIAHEMSPYHPEIQKTLGRTLAGQKRHIEALSVFQQAVEIYPGCEWGHEGIVISAGEVKNFELKALSQKKLLDIHKPSAEEWCDYGETLIRLGKFDEAQDAFEAAARLDPTCVRAYQAPELIKIEKARAEGEKLAAQGMEAFSKKFFLTASERLERAIELVPGQLEWIKVLAELSLKTAETERAATLLSRLRSCDDSDYMAGFNLARVYEHENKLQLAIELLTTVTRDNPGELEAHLMLLRLKRSQIRGSRVELDMLDALIRNVELELSHIRRDSPVPLLVKGYANYIFSFRSKFQTEGFARAEKAFKEAMASFADNEAAVRGLALVERARGNVDRAVELTKSLVKLSSDPQTLFELGRLHENFQQPNEARKCYASLRSLFPENGFYRRKMIEMTAELSKSSSKNELMNMLSEYHQSLQSRPDQIWTIYETAMAQELIAEFNTQSDEWVKKSLLNWHKAANHADANHWVRWGMLRCQFKYLKGSDLQRAASTNLKACEKILRDMPDNHMAFEAVARCLMAFGDLANIDKAMGYLEKAWFLSRTNSETAVLMARTAKELGKSVMVDSIGYNMILLEPELATIMLQG